jgi:hypothetical protein
MSAGTAGVHASAVNRMDDGIAGLAFEVESTVTWKYRIDRTRTEGAKAKDPCDAP